ncbi:allene oxide synthase 1, chloroplastic-like [Lotus japonicus]|uniref:allene oxide synthase 1, chloroplastic-like n=1 Tax=Lotus japonicus TaxID=34305 RepID=UPI002586E2F8|nr:allene oxide synthase 1, chloroplastic-like [Lotus japonicus]
MYASTIMASSLTSLPSPFLQLEFPSKNTNRPYKCNHSSFSIRASTNETPSLSSPPSSAPATTPLPMRKIPSDYGLPIIGPVKDRLDYFYNQGRDKFFQSRMRKYNSTVYRVNMPPGPFISSNPNVIVLLDGKSFPTLFDVSKVEKRDLFTGTFMPSTELTGGYRTLSYLDPSEERHHQLKRLMFFLLKSRISHVIPEFHSSYTELFNTLENDLAEKGKAIFADVNDQAAFNFLAKALYGTHPSETHLGRDGPSIITKWTLFQISPILKLGLPKLIEESIFHTFRLPPALIKKDYQKLYNFFYESSGPLLDEAVRLGVSREEACHNLLFATCFNSYGGIRVFFPIMLKWIGRAGVKLHTRLAEEIRSAVRTHGGGKVTMAAIEAMPLLKSVVYEVFRIEPPVALQYGKAKRDLLIESHDNVFQVKEGEMLFGFQPFATKDPKIFDRADEFVGDRFMGEGEKLLKHVLWSNGPETEKPTLGDKQCAGKDLGMLYSRLLVVELFLRYDSFDIQVGPSPIGHAITFTSLKRASF